MPDAPKTWTGPKMSKSNQTPPPSADPARARVAALAAELIAGEPRDGDARTACREVYRQFGEAGLLRVRDSGLKGGALAAHYLNDPAAFVARFAPPSPPSPPAAAARAAAPGTSPEAAKLLEECGAVRVRRSWFPTSKAVDRADKSRMAAAAGATADGVSAGKRLFTKDHPTVAAANQLWTRVQGYLKGVSLPVLQLGAGPKAQGGQDTEKKEGGTYLVRKTEMASFEDHMAAFKSELASMTVQVNRDLEAIKAADRAKLGDVFRDGDYPAAVKLDVDYYPVNLEPPAYLAKFAPKMFERERRKAEKWWEGVYQTAAGAFVEEFKKVVDNWVERLGPVTILFPPLGHPHRRLYNAEVLKQATDEAGAVKATVRVRVDGKTTQDQDVEFTADEWASLKPTVKPDARKTFQTGTIAHMHDMIVKFRSLGEAVSAGADFTALVDQIEQTIGKAGNSPEAVADQLRKGDVFRADVHKLMQQASAALGGQLQVVRTVRRRVAGFGQEG